MRISRQKKNKSFFTPNRLILVVVSFILIEYVGLLFERYAESSQPRQLSEQNEKPQLRKAKAASGDTKKSNTPTASSFAKNNELVVKKESLQLHDTTDTALGTNGKSGAVLNDILSNYYPEGVWDDLLEEAAHQLQQHKSPGVAMEVGMHRPVQCLQAAKAGLEAHCVEPSPKSFERVQKGVKKAPADVQERVHLYNVAAGGTSEGFVPFTSSGGTGDHVGGHNMWTMTTNDLEHPKDDSYGYPVAPRKPVEDGANKLLPGEIDLRKKNQEIIQVPSMRLDDIVEKTADGVFLLKVDTQGFEPTVLSGLTKSLTQHNVQYLLMEYWPRGMDLLAGEKDACIGAKLLQTLVDNGYTLYALNVQAHPKAPQGWKSLVSSRPMDNLQENCRWYFSVEDKLPSVEYKMGYWSDILAVAPTAQLSGAQTRTGMALQSGLVMQK